MPLLASKSRHYAISPLLAMLLPPFRHDVFLFDAFFFILRLLPLYFLFRCRHMNISSFTLSPLLRCFAAAAA